MGDNTSDGRVRKRELARGRLQAVYDIHAQRGSFWKSGFLCQAAGGNGVAYWQKMGRVQVQCEVLEGLLKGRCTGGSWKRMAGPSLRRWPVPPLATSCLCFPSGQQSPEPGQMPALFKMAFKCRSV